MRTLKLTLLLLVLLSPHFLDAQSSDISQGCFPLTVQFTAPSGFNTYFWDFGDGASSNLENPSNTFSSSGTFVVEFSEFPGGSIIGTVTINVYEQPTPTFTADPSSGCAPLNVSFSDNTSLSSGITITSYSWVFGDGANATGATTSHVFDAGSHSVSFGIITNLPSCNNTVLYDNYISVSNSPNANFTTSDPTSCTAPLTVSFNNTSTSDETLSYSWDLGNGETSTATNPPDQTYTEEGSYVVTLTATDPNGCQDEQSITIGIGQPIASFEIPDTICLGQGIGINNTSPFSSVTWDFGPNATPGTSSSFNPFVTFTSAGIHDITLHINGDCPNEITQSVFVEDASAAFTSTPSYACSSPLDVNFTPENQNAASYFWSFANGESSSETNPSITYEDEDTLTYSINGPHEGFYFYTTTLNIVTASGCQAFYSVTDTLYEPNALIFPDVVSGCVPLTVNFTDESTADPDVPIDAWEWFFGDGTSITESSSTDPEHTYNNIGVFNAYLIITNDMGCKDTSYFNPIAVGDQMTPDFTASPMEICPGETVDFTDITAGPLADSIDAWHFSTENNMSTHCYTNPNPSWTYNEVAGPQDVTLTVEFNGCYSSTTQSGFINILGPKAKINYACTCDAPLEVNFENQSQEFTSLSWDFGDGETATEENPIHSYATPGDYQVILTAFNDNTSCPESIDTMMVPVRVIEANFGSDSLLCQGINSPFSAGASEGVFEDCLRGYHWFFSDPAIHPYTSASPAAGFAFPTTGLNDVSLVVTDINGCKDTITHTVDVYGIQSEFSFEPDTICLPMEVNFTNSSFADTTIVSWAWSFDDGTTSELINPTHIFTSSQDIGQEDYEGNNITLLVTDTIGCSASMSSLLLVYNVTSDITVSDNSLCSGDAVNFSATDFTSQGSNLSFDWDFGNSQTSQDQNPQEITYNDAGSYPVMLYFEEIATGCYDSTFLTINVVDYPVADFTSSADSNLYVCPNDNVLFTNTSTPNNPNMNFFWDFDNGATSTFADPGTSYANNGAYTVELIASIAAPYGCADTTQQTFNVQGPIGSFTTDLGTGTICRLDSVLFTLNPSSVVDTFYWDFGDGTGASGISPIYHQYNFVPPSGQTTALLIMANSDGSCPTTEEAPVNIYEVIADFTRNFNDIDTALCFQPYPLQNTSENANTYAWDFGDGTSSGANQPNTHNYANPGTYEITLAIQNQQWGCTDTISKEVVLYPIPDIAVLGDTICEGEAGQLTVINPISSASYAWTANTNIPIFNADQPQANSIPLLTTNYNAIVIDTNGCNNEAMTSIVVVNDLDIFDFDTIVPQGEIVMLPLSFDPELFEIVWTPETSQGTGCLTCSPPYAQAIDDQTYHLTISDYFGCFSADAAYEILVHPETFIAMPTTFTPNGDGVNDIIYVAGWGIKELLEYQIFNRYGELVFETTDQAVGWNGYYKGKIQNNDAYAFKVKALTWKNEEKVLEGYINLMR